MGGGDGLRESEHVQRAQLEAVNSEVLTPGVPTTRQGIWRRWGLQTAGCAISGAALQALTIDRRRLQWEVERGEPAVAKTEKRRAPRLAGDPSEALSKK
jgi:hypothetical protein